MSGEELKKKLKDAGYTQAEVARKLGVVPQSIIQTLEAKDIKTGFLEDLCRVLNVDMGFFYEINSSSVSGDANKELRKQLNDALSENALLKLKLKHQSDPDKAHKESEIYQLWMEHMKIEKMRTDFNDKMREMYQKMMEG